MRQGNSVHVSEDGLSVVAAMAAANGGLQRALITLAAGHGGKAGPWLDEFEAILIRDTKNMVFEGSGIEEEAAAVRYALENLDAVMNNVRERLSGTSA
jgi:hypothetical protein